MPLPLEEIEAEALALPDAVRAQLAGRLMVSLDSTESGSMDGLWMQEAAHRLDDLRSGWVAGIPGEAALSQLRRKYQ